MVLSNTYIMSHQEVWIRFLRASLGMLPLSSDAPQSKPSQAFPLCKSLVHCISMASRWTWWSPFQLSADRGEGTAVVSSEKPGPSPWSVVTSQPDAWTKPGLCEQARRQQGHAPEEMSRWMCFWHQILRSQCGIYRSAKLSVTCKPDPRGCWCIIVSAPGFVVVSASYLSIKHGWCFLNVTTFLRNCIDSSCLWTV